MPVVTDDVQAFVDRWTAANRSGGTRAGYFAVYGGKNARGARALTAKLRVEGEPDREELYEELGRRISSARAESGVKRLFVRFYEVGETHPSDTIVLDGDPGGAPADDEDSTDMSLAQAHALVVTTLVRSNADLTQQLGSMSVERGEIQMKAAIALTELDVRNQLGSAHAFGEAARALAPSLEKTVPLVVQAWLQHEQERMRAAAGAPTSGAPLGPVTPADQVRASIADAEGALQRLGATCLALGSDFTSELRSEVVGRLRPYAEGLTAAASAPAS